MSTRFIETPYGRVKFETVTCSECGLEAKSDLTSDWLRVVNRAELSAFGGTGLHFGIKPMNPVSGEMFCSVECLASAVKKLHTFESKPTEDACAVCDKSGRAHEQRKVS